MGAHNLAMRGNLFRSGRRAVRKASSYAVHTLPESGASRLRVKARLFDSPLRLQSLRLPVQIVLPGCSSGRFYHGAWARSDN